ncbi:MAG TPA: alginate export family protein [Bdellovibrionales bacterium]|nr:alginate export family protein [Bdellovibrionales bacterium]
MRRVLALAALLAFLPTANAQDKAKADFSANAEYRARYWLMQNPLANKDALSTNSMVDHRFKLGTAFRANEKFTANMTLLHDDIWGQGDGEPLGERDHATGGTESNFLAVNEAYASWMFSEDMNFKFGRQNYQISDGYVMATNDWEQQPFAFDGVVGSWDAEFGRFQLFAFKYRELTGVSASGNPEHNAYGLNFDLKTNPEWLKALNVHVIKDNADAVEGATGADVESLSGQDMLRYGAHAGFHFGMLDLHAWYAANNGKYKQIAAGGAKNEIDGKGMMYMAELGFNFENFMASRLHVRYHASSGDKDATDGEEGTYDPYFNERHNAAGMMDLYNWGNLTYTQVGFTMKPGDKTTVGLQYSMFALTENTAGVNAGRFGAGLGSGSGSSDKLGDEIDLWAEHAYDGGLSTVLRLGHFMPGDRYDNTTSNQGDAITQLMVEGKLNF